MRLRFFVLSMLLVSQIMPRIATCTFAQVSKNVIRTCQNLRFSTERGLPIKIGDSIPFKILVEFPNYPFSSNTQLIICPEIHFEKTLIPLKPMRFKAIEDPEDVPSLVQDTMMALLSRRGDYLFEHEVIAPYIPGMESATLEARITIIEDTKSMELPLQRISQSGFSTYSRFLEEDLELMDIDCEKEGLCVKESFVLNFNPNDYLYVNVLNQGVLQGLIKLLSSNREILQIEISGSASPEGESSINENLAFKRMEDINKLIVRELMSRKHNPMSSNDILNGQFISSKWTQQTWQSITNQVELSKFNNADKIRTILESSLDEKEKSVQLSKFSRFMDFVQQNVFAKQRICKVEILSTPSDDKVILDIADFQKGKISKSIRPNRLVQMGMAAENDKLAESIYKKCIDWYPDNYKAYFKLGILQYSNQQFENAQKSFLQSSQLNPKSGESLNNLAACQSKTGSLNEALINLKMASNLGKTSPSNLAYVHAKLGKHIEALHWASVEPTNNNAIHYMIQDQPYEALKILDKIENSKDITLYLAAIAATKINDIALMCEKLTSAIQLNPACRDWARKEAEFNPYRNNEQFRVALRRPSDQLNAKQ